MKILVRATNWIGDAVISLPALRVLRQRYAGAEIVVLARPWVAGLYEGEKSVDRIVELAGAPGLRDFRTKRRASRALRSERFDLAILLPNSFESAFLARLAGARRIIGYARDGRGFLLTDAIAVPAKGEIPRHETYYYLELLRRSGLIESLPPVNDVRFDGIEAARRRGEALFAMRGVRTPVVGVSPGAAYGCAKRWIPERFAESARGLAAALKGSVAVFGSASESPLCEEVARAALGRSFAGATTLREFIDMTVACRIFLTNDSGAMHIAGAAGTPCVAIFGPTDEFATGPMGPLSAIVREKVECAPCLLRECPLDHRCMTRVSAQRVIETAGELFRIAPARC